jgi:iron complex outermembrane receptor protein
VLKGPQGTLFGRNATGGAILVKTRDPQFTPAGQFIFGYGNYREVRANGYVTGGITDTLAAEVSAYYRHSDGYIKDLLTGEDRGQQRSADLHGKLLWKPTDSLRFILGAAHTETSDPTGLAFNALGGNSAGRASIRTRRSRPSAVRCRTRVVQFSWRGDRTGALARQT